MIVTVKEVIEMLQGLVGNELRQLSGKRKIKLKREQADAIRWGLKALKLIQESDITTDEIEQFVRCEDCIHGGWTDDVQTHCNKWHTQDDPMCVGYLDFCGAGEKGEMLEMKEYEDENNGGEPEAWND